MDRSRPDRILEEWNAVADEPAGRPTPPRRVVVRAVCGPTLAGASLVAVVLVAARVARPPGSTGPGGSSRSPSATRRDAAPSASPTPTQRRRRPTPTPTPTATPTPVAEDRRLRPRRSSRPGSRMWEGAAGRRIAHVEVTNSRRDACKLETMERPQLVDGRGRS